jgi:uncharacterized membrane protein YgdD (TMEM256/DUF423 family)
MLSHEKMMKKAALYSACIGIAVALDAFGAHGLKKLVDPDRIEVFSKANKYLLNQNIALLALLFFNQLMKRELFFKSMNLLSIGTFLFSISLYLLTFKNLENLSILDHFKWTAPIGGSLMVIAWCLIVYSFIKNQSVKR